MTEQKTNLAERFEFRAVRPDEAEWAAENRADLAFRRMRRVRESV